MISLKKLTVITAILLVACLIILSVILLPRVATEKNLQVIFLDVGQGDSILIKTPVGRNILIDGGPDNSVVEGLGKYLPFYKREIDLMILTHPEADHVTGLVETLRRYNVKKIFYTGALHTTSNYLAWLEQIKKEGSVIKIIDSAEEINLENNLSLKVLFPLQSFLNQRVEKLNNTSIVTKLIYNKTSFLFTGDIEEEVEREILAQGAELNADILKVAHHGSKTSTGQEFLTAVAPQIAVIQVGGDNRFGHPHYRTIRALEKNNIQIFRNDQHGYIVIESDGENITVTTE